jgi:LacI family transcriptional regulator
VVDRELPGVDVDAVLVDNLGGGRQATGYLVELGHRRIGCITGPSATTPSAERVTGYRQALCEAGLPDDEALVVRGDFLFGSGFAGTKTLLTGPDPPTAVFVCNDAMAVGAIAAAAELGYQVPADLSIVGFDNITLAAYTMPPLTTIAQPIREIGRLAADTLIRRIQDPTGPHQRHVLKTELVMRRSAARPGTRRRE